MQKIEKKDYSVFQLADLEFFDAKLKNECIKEAKTKYFVFAFDALEVSFLEECIQQTGAVKDDKILVWMLGKEMQEISYKDIFSLQAPDIYGIGVPERFLRECGFFNSHLTKGDIYELLCRIVCEVGICSVVSVDEVLEETQQLVWDVDAFTMLYAYVFRYHMNMLYKLNLTDAIFTDLCQMMKQIDCFAEFQQYLNLYLKEEREYEKVAGETAPFLILRGDETCYGILQKFADELYESLLANGQVVKITQNSINQDELIKHQIYKGIIGFQTKALENPFFSQFHGPKYQFWTDYPLHFENILRNLPDDHYVLCQDADHAAQIRNYFHTPNGMQFPPGGMNVELESIEECLDCREYDISFIGTYFQSNEELLNAEQRVYYDYMLAHPNLNFEQGLCQLLGISEEDSRNEEFEKISRDMKPACRFVLAYYREKVLRTILESGLDIHVYGDDWYEFDTSNCTGKLIVHPVLTADETIQEWRKSKIGLNIMSWHKAGMTERIANIMLSGAVCLSDETSFLKENLKEEENIVLFNLNCLEEVPKKIKKILEEDSYRKHIARNAFRIAKQEFTWDVRAKQLIALSNQYFDRQDKIRIFVATHVSFQPPANPIYVPIHVGKSGKQDLGYLGDDTGDNISDLNFLYGELTGLYWIWKNVNRVEYLGLCHYRRYFINSKMQELKQDECLELLKDCDALVPKHMECEGGISYYEQFGKAHNIHDLDAVRHALERLYPDYIEVFDRAMSGTVFYWGNLMITKADILRSYAEWLFNIFVEASEEIDVSGYDAYHTRVYGFLSEQMFYVYALANHLKLKEVAVGVSAEKAETKQLKELLVQLMAEGKREEARKLLEKQLKTRPDLLLAGSDIHNELHKIYEELL